MMIFLRPTRQLKKVWLFSFGSLILGFPFYTALVFIVGADRDITADILSTQAMVCYWVGMAAAFFPLSSLRSWSFEQRLHSVCQTYLMASIATHLSWELIWLLNYDAISAARDHFWAYPWWGYIDGGDIRYYNPDVEFIMMETLSVFNGCQGLLGLVLLWRSSYTSLAGILLCFSMAVFHTVLTWFYYGTEILSGFASVNTESFFDLWVKFILLNGPWLVFPWLVIIWSYKLLRAQQQK